MSGRGALGQWSLPPTGRRLVRAVTTGIRRPTASLRALPDFLVIGAQRSGTTSLFYYLAAHAGVFGPFRNKGVHYFDAEYHRSLDWYRSHFPTRRTLARVDGPTAVGEASPYYLFHPEIPGRVARELPGVKLIAVLRDPVERTISHHQHEVARGHESLPLEAALAAEDDRLAGEAELLAADPRYVSRAHMHHAYVARSRYAEQLERWLEHVGSGRLLVLRSADLAQRPAETVAAAWRFLGLDPMAAADYPIYNERSYDRGDPAVRARLADGFADSERRVDRLIERHGIEHRTQ